MIVVYILLGILGFFILVAGTFYLVGSNSPKEYQGTASHTFRASKGKVWRLLTDLQVRQNRRREVKSLEVTGQNEQGLEEWKEITDMGGHIFFETVEKVPEDRYVIRMIESTFGMSGTFTYQLTGDEQTCTLKITEDSIKEKVWVRAMYAMAGKDAAIKMEFRSLKRALAKGQ